MLSFTPDSPISSWQAQWEWVGRFGEYTAICLCHPFPLILFPPQVWALHRQQFFSRKSVPDWVLHEAQETSASVPGEPLSPSPSLTLVSAELFSPSDFLPPTHCMGFLPFLTNTFPKISPCCLLSPVVFCGGVTESSWKWLCVAIVSSYWRSPNLTLNTQNGNKADKSILGHSLPK